MGWLQISGQELARLVDMKQTTMSLKLRAKSEFTSSELDRLVPVLRIDHPGVLYQVPEGFGDPASGGSSSAWLLRPAGQRHFKAA